MPACNGSDRGCNITPPERGPTSPWSLVTREPDQPTPGASRYVGGATPLVRPQPTRACRHLVRSVKGFQTGDQVVATSAGQFGRLDVENVPRCGR
jgi:hypothetical protein